MTTSTGPGWLCQPNEPPGSTVIEVTSIARGPFVLIWTPALLALTFEPIVPWDSGVICTPDGWAALVLPASTTVAATPKAAIAATPVTSVGKRFTTSPLLRR